MPKYSIVVPFHNEEENVTALYDRLKAVMEQIGDSFELVLVDDGSSDRTYKLLEEIAAVDSRVLVVKLRRNFGQTSALAAGFDHSQGDLHPRHGRRSAARPRRDPRLCRQAGRGLRRGQRMAQGAHRQLRHAPDSCRVVANWLMAKLSGVDIHDFGTTFKAYRREVIHNIPLYGEMHRFIPALASWYGASICEIPIKNVNRERGKSHYGISRTFRVFFDLLTIRFLSEVHDASAAFLRHSLARSAFCSEAEFPSFLAGLKVFTHQHVMDEHGPLFVVAGCLDPGRHSDACHRPARRIAGPALSHLVASRALRHRSPRPAARP